MRSLVPSSMKPDLNKKCSVVSAHASCAKECHESGCPNSWRRYRSSAVGSVAFHFGFWPMVLYIIIGGVYGLLIGYFMGNIVLYSFIPLLFLTTSSGFIPRRHTWNSCRRGCRASIFPFLDFWCSSSCWNSGRFIPASRFDGGGCSRLAMVVLSWESSTERWTGVWLCQCSGADGTAPREEGSY